MPSGLGNTDLSQEGLARIGDSNGVCPDEKRLGWELVLACTNIGTFGLPIAAARNDGKKRRRQLPPSLLFIVPRAASPWSVEPSTVVEPPRGGPPRSGHSCQGGLAPQCIPPTWRGRMRCDADPPFCGVCVTRPAAACTWPPGDSHTHGRRRTGWGGPWSDAERWPFHPSSTAEVLTPRRLLPSYVERRGASCRRSFRTRPVWRLHRRAVTSGARPARRHLCARLCTGLAILDRWHQQG